MIKSINNYDTSSTMEDCELCLMLDCEQARYDFEDCFEIMQHEGNRTSALYFYADCGNSKEKPDCASECYDFSECSEKDFRAFVWDTQCAQADYRASYYKTYDPVSSYENARNMVDEMMTTHDTWKDYAISIIDDEDISIYIRDDHFPDIDNSKLVVEWLSVRGYSQGDYADIILWESSIWKSFNPENKEPLPRDKILSTMRSHFENLVFNQPIYCRLEVDGEEFYFDQKIKDVYEWDTDEIIEIARTKFKLSEPVLKWLEENLPDHPEASY